MHVAMIILQVKNCLQNALSVDRFLPIMSLLNIFCSRPSFRCFLFQFRWLSMLSSYFDIGLPLGLFPVSFNFITTLRIDAPSILMSSSTFQYLSANAQTCQVSRNFRESPEMEHDLQVSRKCSNISRNLIDLHFSAKKHAFGVNSRGFWCEFERILV